MTGVEVARLLTANILWSLKSAQPIVTFQRNAVEIPKMLAVTDQQITTVVIKGTFSPPNGVEGILDVLTGCDDLEISVNGTVLTE